MIEGIPMREIHGKKGRDVYLYDEKNLTVTDKEGNVLKLYESLEGLPESNVSWYVDDLFHELYGRQNEVALMCRCDKETGIEVIYYLMHKDIITASMEVSNTGDISKVRVVNEQHLPLGYQLNMMKFHEW